MSSEKYDVLVVGGGPAGLRAAELTSAAGLRTVLADHKPSVGRKFLVAGRGGLNLTHSEPVENFPARYGDSTERWRKLLADFSPDDLARLGEGPGHRDVRRHERPRFSRRPSRPRRCCAAGSSGCASRA